MDSTLIINVLTASAAIVASLASVFKLINSLLRSEGIIKAKRASIEIRDKMGQVKVVNIDALEVGSILAALKIIEPAASPESKKLDPPETIDGGR